VLCYSICHFLLANFRASRWVKRGVPAKKSQIFCWQFPGQCSFLEKIAGRLPMETCPVHFTRKTLADYTMKNKYNLAARAAVLTLALTAAFAFTTTAFAYSPAASDLPGAGSTVGSDGILPFTNWYNGDLNHVNGLANERDDSLGLGEYAHVFDDFIVPNGQTWNVTGVYSNNYNNMTGLTGVEWSIRQGITTGNGGTLIASGTNTGNNYQVLFHNPGDFGYTEFSVNALNLSGISLTAGTYFLNVTPIGSGNGRSFTSDTSGAGCIGNPCGNNGNAFFDSNFFGANYQPTGTQGQPGDFSMGVQVAEPEPPPWAMMAMGAVVLIGVQQLCRRRKKA
jgi:hypothetical protein